VKLQQTAEYEKSGGNIVVILNANKMDQYHMLDWLTNQEKHMQFSHLDKKIGEYVRSWVRVEIVYRGY
jgi:hypothetical protein